MTNNLKIFLNLREQANKACNCNPNKMKCGGDPMCCTERKHKELQGKMWVVLTLLTHSEQVELNKHDGYSDDDIMTRLLYNDEQRAYEENERLKMIAELSLPENQWKIRELGVVI